MLELPRCPDCRLSVQPDQVVVFAPDGRIHHRQCPKVLCSLCAGEIMRHEPIRRDGDALAHAACWARRFRRRPSRKAAWARPTQPSTA